MIIDLTDLKKLLFTLLSIFLKSLFYSKEMYIKKLLIIDYAFLFFFLSFSLSIFLSRFSSPNIYQYEYLSDKLKTMYI